eukprot:75538_1
MSGTDILKDWLDESDDELLDDLNIETLQKVQKKCVRLDQLVQTKLKEKPKKKLIKRKLKTQKHNKRARKTATGTKKVSVSTHPKWIANVLNKKGIDKITSKHLENQDLMKSLRAQSYSEYARIKSLKKRTKLPNKIEQQIRNVFPDPKGKYTGFKEK